MIEASPACRLEQHDRCRLCGGRLRFRFELRVRHQHDVGYFSCEQCLSLQTEPPYWLEEAYANNNLSHLDTGAAQRCLHNLAACWSISRLLGLNNVLDIGGGDGLLCRLLRDHQINCFVQDKYAAPTYAQGFAEPDFATPDMVVAFEVLEHYPEPGKELDQLFRHRPRALLASTGVFKNENQDWWYLARESGQHVFFYSSEALALIARKYGYELLVSGGYQLFLKQGCYGPLQRAIARMLLRLRMRRLSTALLVMSSAHGVHKDHLLQIEKSRRRST